MAKYCCCVDMLCMEPCVYWQNFTLIEQWKGDYLETSNSFVLPGYYPWDWCENAAKIKTRTHISHIIF